MSDPAASKRPYRIDPVVAHERARLGANARNSPDGYIRALARATLTTAQKRRLASMLMPFLDEEPTGEDSAAGAGAR